MSLPEIASEVAWLDIQAQIKARIGPSVRGTIDSHRVHDNTYFMVTRLLDGVVDGCFVSVATFEEMGIDRLAARLVLKFRELQQQRNPK